MLNSASSSSRDEANADPGYRPLGLPALNCLCVNADNETLTWEHVLYVSVPLTHEHRKEQENQKGVKGG